MGKLNSIFTQFQLDFAREYYSNYAHLKYSCLKKHFNRTDMALDGVLDAIVDLTGVRLWNSYSKEHFKEILYLSTEHCDSMECIKVAVGESFELDKEEYEVTYCSLLGEEAKPKTLDQSEILEWVEEFYNEISGKFS